MTRVARGSCENLIESSRMVQLKWAMRFWMPRGGGRGGEGAVYVRMRAEGEDEDEDEGSGFQLWG